MRKKRMKKNRIVLCLVFALALTMASCMPVSAYQETARVKYMAHRGAKFKAPENTIAAYRLSNAKQYYGVETDVWVSRARNADGTCQFFMSHEDNLKSYTKKKVNIKNISLANRASYPIVRGSKIKNYGKQIIPTLGEALQNMGQCVPVLHLKGTWSYKACIDAINEIKKYPNITKVTITTASRNQIRTFQTAVQNTDFTLRPLSIDYMLVTYNFSSQGSLNNQIKYCRANGIAAVNLKTTVASAKRIKAFRSAGIKVGVWTTNSKGQNKKYIKRGVDYITTNTYF